MRMGRCGLLMMVIVCVCRRVGVWGEGERGGHTLRMMNGSSIWLASLMTAGRLCTGSHHIQLSSSWLGMVWGGKGKARGRGKFRLGRNLSTLGGRGSGLW